MDILLSKIHTSQQSILQIVNINKNNIFSSLHFEHYRNEARIIIVNNYDMS